ncbi:hypothetical protein BD310DRAFT_838757 [Dichomitus squalens]|uniref:Inner centromere protein ARK-binding domain-containing protein n=1 Tax=Dichomitus squalens TaxID=114155 RepID=A0A4Q9QE42_9APHY|nr:hypothetical protein BD310DRAFT_838757 [Dichomitus squalens]
MDGSRPGEAGVIAWCNSIRFTMAKDPGRQFLYEQIQKEGFDFLDMYLENFLDGPTKEPVIELLKTPGRKKNTAIKTRAATAAAAKVKAVTSMSFEDGEAKENHAPLNNFHKALLQAKEGSNSTQEKWSSHQLSAERSLSNKSLAKVKDQRIVTIADSPAVQASDAVMDVDEVHKPIPAPTFSVVQPVAQVASQGASLEVPVNATNELSMIVEDDELAERSRVSLDIPLSAKPAAVEIDPEPGRPNETRDVFHDAEEAVSDDVLMQDDIADDADMSMADDEQPPQGDVTSASVATFHTIPLSPRREPELAQQSAHTADFHTAPLPRVSLSPIPVEEELHSHTAPLPASSSKHEEYTMPLREEPSAPVPGLSRKPSVAQFTGLPAPSPLRKSLRPPGDASAGSSTGATAAPALGKRTSTSWLSKARETKALETTSKRKSTLDPGIGTFAANKRKSSEMLEAANAVLRSLDEEERATKVPKLANSPAGDDNADKGKGKGKAPSLDTVFHAAPAQPTTSAEIVGVATTAPTSATDVLAEQDDMLATILKKNYEARTGKSMGKSLGGNAAAALAEARAAAEARVAERHKLELGDVSMTSEEKKSSSVDTQTAPTDPTESERRLSVSDLIPSSEGRSKPKAKQDTAQARQPTPPGADTSASTTPPNSPPRSRNTSFVAHTGPVFSKPPAQAPAPSARTESSAPAAIRDYKLPTENPFSIPAAMALGMGMKFQPLSAQSSKASVFSDVVLDRTNASPAWMPSTQDTSYSAAQSQSQPKGVVDDNDDDDDDNELDADDSWGVDEKFASNQMWTPFGFQSANPDQLKDDTMTWSTIPSRSTSQKGGDTQATQSLFPTEEVDEEEEEEREEPEPERGFAERLAAADQQPSDVEDGAVGEGDMAMEIDEDDAEEKVEEEEDFDEAVLAGKSTIKLVQQKSDTSSQPRSDSQQSMASTASSQSNLGLFGQASKLVSSVFGGGAKKAKPEVKSLQLAAAAAKKQQEEQEKKAHRLKEMEARRQQAIQRKAEEEKARQIEEERKIKEETERRKREREEHTDKRPLSRAATAPKKNEDDTSKRKVAATTSQKPPSKEKKDAVPPRTLKPSVGASSKPVLKSALKQPTAGPSGSSVPVTPGASKVPAQKTVKHMPSSSNLKVPPPAASKGKEKDTAEPLRSKTPTGHPPPAQEPPRVASESIELPDINSEYSDSEDEDRPKRDLPDWAKSPDIAAALQQQSTINPDDIFGQIRPLRMEEIFRTRHSRFRARTSSANWTGTDELTQEEEREYARRMGFR